MVTTERDRGLPIRVARIVIKNRDAIAGTRIALSRPDRIFQSVRRIPSQRAWRGAGNPLVPFREHFCLNLPIRNVLAVNI
jgi:hypothetical protein